MLLIHINITEKPLCCLQDVYSEKPCTLLREGGEDNICVGLGLCFVLAGAGSSTVVRSVQWKYRTAKLEVKFTVGTFTVERKMDVFTWKGMQQLLTVTSFTSYSIFQLSGYWSIFSIIMSNVFILCLRCFSPTDSADR